MTPWWRSLRVQLAGLGFLAIALPVVVLLGVSVATETTVVIDGQEITEGTSTQRSPWVVATAVVLAPVAAGLSWWLAGRAVRPINTIRDVAEEIEATDSARRIGLDRGPTEVVGLAASFDAMLDRLADATQEQQRLIEAASHDLRTPLAAVTTNLEVLERLPAPTVEDYRSGLARTRAAADRLRVTLESLLVDARRRVRTIERRPVDVVALARSVIDEAGLLAAARGVGVQLTVELAGFPSATASVDEITVRRALANIVDNAVRHAPTGSAVEVTVAATKSAVTLTVVDSGPGIPVEEQARVFDRHWSGRTDGGGHGLGLAIAAQVAEAHGGTLTLRSPGPTGDGCAFELRLPR